MLIGKTFNFEAAHHLPNHDGKCRRPHGHSYRVEVALSGDPELEAGHPKQGMVLDFSLLGQAFKRLIFERVDHQDLNVVLADEVSVTTAENLAAWIHGQLAAEFGVERMAWVKVWETATSWAQYP